MLRSAKHLTGYTILATDDSLGKVRDFLFDDRSWIIRYLVADTKRWLPGRRVLIPPTALDEPDWAKRVLPVGLTRKQVENSPEISEDEPVSRRRELELHRHYGWAPYWIGADPGHAAAIAAHVRTEPAGRTEEGGGDPHLRSVEEVTGYTIAARDGRIGHLEDLILDDETWLVRYAVVDTRNWLPGKKVVVAPQWMERIRWTGREVEVGLDRERIRAAPEYDPRQPINREYEQRVYDFYGRPVYWDA